MYDTITSIHLLLVLFLNINIISTNINIILHLTILFGYLNTNKVS
jgi:hypothetical protein